MNEPSVPRGSGDNGTFGTNVDEKLTDQGTLEHGLFTAVLEHVADGIVACDADGALVLMNQVARRFHGLSLQSLAPGAWPSGYGLFAPGTDRRLRAERRRCSVRCAVSRCITSRSASCCRPSLGAR